MRTVLLLRTVTYGSTCDQPTSPHGSVIIHPTQREKYQNGQVILFGCKQGFYLDGMPVITCNGKKWTQTQFRCLGFCPEVRSILNGKVSHVTPQVGKAAIEFRCANNSFQLIGRKRLECIDGRWNGKLPYCHKLPSCVRLQSPANGIVHGNDNSHSAEAKFTCFTGFDLFGASTLICNRGVWSFRVPTCKAYCTKIRDLPNGHVFGTRFSHGQVVSFNCKHGYELVGDRSLRCINGGWNSSVPQCKVMQCAKPSIPSNSRIIYPRTDQVRYTHGTTLYLACHQGHLLAGSPIMVCNYTTWLKREFKCIAPCPILGPMRNGVITYVTRKGGGEVEIKCHANYTLSGSSRLSCINGEWSNSVPSCKALCPTPIAPTNGRIQGRDFRHGQSIKFWCSRGYTRVGAFSVTCKEGKWGAPFPVCKASCGRPSIPANGRIVGNIFSHGKSVLFYCSFGYTRVGAGSIKCDDGKWDKPFPVCKGICPTPSDPRNGKLGQKVSLEKRFLDGDEATFSCNRGYDLIGKKRLRCVGKVWDFGEPECKAPCNPPGFPANGNGQWRDLKHNSWVTFSCDKKYQLVGRRQMQCKDGIWSGNRPKCVALCPDPGEPLRGKRHGNNFRNGSVITFTCNTDHELIGNNTTRCEDGVWSGSVPLCKGKCKFQGSPKNGYTPNGIYVNGKLFSHGSNIEYACYAPYTMDGTNILHCNDGFWNASIPSCKATCTDPGLIDRGERNGTNFSHGQVVTYECSTKNYSLVGNPRLTCNDGFWDSAPPVCKKSCNPLPPLSNGKIHNNGVSHETVVSFSCNSGFKPLGSLQIKCLDGIWNESSPSCIGVCNEPRKLINGKVVGSNYSYGSVIKFECNKGYELKGSANLKCKGGVWEGQFPKCEVCVRVGSVFWGFWRRNQDADSYWKASITRITATHFDFALVLNNKQTRSYRRTDQKLIIDKVPSIGDLLPNSLVIAQQFGHSGWYRTGKVTGTSGDSWVEVQFDDGEKKWVPLESVRLLSYPGFCSDVE
ncbi:CUB and sushi domain-containing protein 1 isoform X2 [Pocillopora verrucosa]|uniref:CUB and sushi domain-containing protein 1 isoform X2 n=1 Tax=Pocillopora verrucosa TaxID=203993 RepID=UPI00333E8C3D